jgi:hypothetical protein
MSKPPFKLTDQKSTYTGANPGQEGKGGGAFGNRAAGPPGRPAQRAEDEGITLVEAGEEEAAPDYDVGEDGAKGMGPHKPAIPWPPAATGKKPFKL